MIRLILTAVLIVHKYFDDDFFSNAAMAGYGGLQLAELNALEASFLLTLDFNVHVCDDDIIKFKQGIVHFFEESNDTQS